MHHLGLRMKSASTSPITPYIDVEGFFTILNRVTASLGLDSPPLIHIDQLRSLPLGTFGRAWADHLDSRGLKPLNQGPRRQQLHDGVHVLTGYDTDLIGEAEVQAFLLGAKFRLAQVVFLAGLVRRVNHQRWIGTVAISSAAVRSRVRSAYRRGQQVQFDVDTWQPEHLLHKPLSEVQVQFGLRR